MDYDSRIVVLGHTGLVGSAIYRELERRGYAWFGGFYRGNKTDLIDSLSVVVSVD